MPVHGLKCAKFIVRMLFKVGCAIFLPSGKSYKIAKVTVSNILIVVVSQPKYGLHAVKLLSLCS